MDRSDLEQWKPKEVARLLALVEAERRYYQEIVAGLPVGLLVLSSDLSVISSNVAIRRIFRLRGGDSLRGRLDVLMPADVLDKVRDAFASGAPQSEITIPVPAEHGAGSLRIVIQPIRSWDYTEEQEALLTILETGPAAPAREAAAEPVVEPLAEPTIEPEAEAAPEAVPEVVPEVAPEAIPEVVPGAVAEPTAEPAPEPTVELAPEPTAEPTSEPEPESAPIAELESPEPSVAQEAPEEAPIATEAPAPEAVPEVVPETVEELAPELVAEPLSEPLPEPEPEAIPEPGAVELLQSLDAIVWAAALPDLRFLFVNDAAQRLLGWTVEQWTEAPAFHEERIHPDDRERVAREYRSAIQSGASITVEFRAMHANGGTVWLRETVRPLLDDEGTPRHAVGFAIDITERRREEEARIQAARADALNRLCSRLAHDMNNLLMIVNGYSEDILNTFVGASALQTDLAEVRRAGERLSGIADQLLGFTRRKAEEATSLDGTGVLHEVTAALATTLPEGITLIVSANAPVYVRAAKEQLRESLSAFVEYAVHSLPKGGEIAMATREEAGAGVIAMTYAGEESAESWQSLFEGILAVKDGPAAIQGISRAWSWVQQWGGAIDVETAPGAGTKVAIRLPAGEAPAVAPEPPVAEPAVEPAPEPEPEPQPETVLVVEDEAGIRTLVRKILERQGYRVLDAPQADAAIRLCQEFQGIIQLVITDVIMPEMGGREMVEKLLEIRPGIKVLYVSGYTDDPQVHAAHISQGSAFLQKPFTLGALLDKVREVLEA